MYSSTGDGKTMIKIGGNGKSRVEPLYSVPIQTTATLNIQLLMQKGNSSSDSRPAQSSGPVTSFRAPASSAISATRVNIVAEVPGPRRPSHPADDATSSFGTQTDFGTKSRETSSQIGIVSAGNYSNPAGVSGGGASATYAVGGDGTLSSVGSSSATQTGFLTDSSSHYGFPPTATAHSSTPQTAFSDSASQCCFPDPISSSRVSDTSSQCGSSTLTSVSSSSSSSFRGDADDDVGSEYRVFTDADGGGTEGGGGSGGGGRGGSDKAASKLAQMFLGMDGAGGAGGGEGGGAGGSASDWKTEDDEDDDSDSGESWEELGKPAVPSTFNVIEWNLPNEKSPKSMACSRVIIMKDKDMILMIKTTCSTPKAGNDRRMLSLIVDIADNCSKRLRKMKTLPNLCAQHMDTLPLSDGRTTKEHLSEISRNLGETVGIREVAYRFQPPGDNYIGTFVQGTVLAKRNYAIGRLGVVAILFKKSKYATVEAFSEQLCEHIAVAQPTTLGHLSDLDLKRLNRRGTTRIQHLQKDQLLIQNFAFDPTIIVAEAARRSFVRIDDFLLFK